MPEAEQSTETSLRPFWSGTLSFGLVSIPVELFPATRRAGESLRMLGPEGTPLRQQYFAPSGGKEVTRDRLVRGYERESGEYVVMSDEELEALEPKKSRDIDLRLFVDADVMDPMYFERAYFLTPSGESTKAYRLLAETLQRSGRAGIATFVMRDREYLIAIMAERGILRAETLRFHDEIKTPKSVGLPQKPKLSPQAVRRFEDAIAKHAAKTIDPKELKDESIEKLKALVKSKHRRRKDVVVSQEDEAQPEAKVIDLMEVLRRRLQGGGEEPRSEISADLTKYELYERAQELDIAGRAGMTKSQLLKALRKRL